MDVKASLLAGIKAALMGSLCGTSIATLFAIYIAFEASGTGDGLAILLLVIVPFVAGAICAAIGLLVFGVPLTLWLRRKGRESGAAYAMSGAGGGAILPLAVLLLAGLNAAALVPAFFGMLTGAATGYFWWRYARKAHVLGEVGEVAHVFG